MLTSGKSQQELDCLSASSLVQNALQLGDRWKYTWLKVF
jgi:hypothetical protein